MLGEVCGEQPGYVEVRLARAVPRVGVDALAADLVRVRVRVRARLGPGLGLGLGLGLELALGLGLDALAADSA